MGAQMFNKSKPANEKTAGNPSPAVESTPAPAPAPVSRPAPAAATNDPGAPSIISAALHITGNLDSASDVQIKGSIDGDVKARSVTLDESGVVKGKVMADVAHVNGTVEGQILAKTVSLAGSARVNGDILHESLSIEAGAYVDGNCRRMKDSDRDSSKGAGNGAASPGAKSASQQGASA